MAKISQIHNKIELKKKIRKSANLSKIVRILEFLLICYIAIKIS